MKPHSSSIKILQLFQAPNATKERLDMSFPMEDFEDIDLLQEVQAEFTLLRVEEGIALLVDHLETSVRKECSRCSKPIDLEVSLEGGEWIFYEEEPESYDDENEFLFINLKQFEIDPLEPVRQELILNIPNVVHCSGSCAEFDEPDQGVKALSKLRDLLQEENH